MDNLKLLDDAKKEGVTLEVVNGDLRIEAPRSKKHWLDKLQPHKQEILSHLNGEPSSEELAELPQECIERYQPFPVQTLPGPVGDFVRAAAEAIGCDPSFIALPLLACFGRAIGNKRAIRLKRTWMELPIIWAAIIGKSGTHKTPGLKIAMSFLQRRQGEAIAQHAEAMNTFEQEKAQYDRDYQAWRKSKSDEQPPWSPVEPVCERFITGDTTIEALVVLLAAQFDGLLVFRDELAGFFGSFDQYKGGKGSDKGHWLAMWSGEPLTVDRKSGDKKMLHVPRAASSIVGGIQPAVLRNAIMQEHLEDGLCARLLLACPESEPVRWSEATVNPEVEAALGHVFDHLLAMEAAADSEGNSEPFPLDLSPEAKEVWVDYYNRHRAEGAELDDDLAAAWSKLEAYTARFALIFELCTWAAGDAAAATQISEDSMRSAIELSDWFGNEAKRVYGMFSETEEDREQRELEDLIQSRGGSITPRELTRSRRRYRGAGVADAALEALVKAGRGTWTVSSTATNQRREFTLTKVSTAVTVTDSPESREIDECVTVTTGTSPATLTNNGHDPDAVKRLQGEAGAGDQS